MARTIAESAIQEVIENNPMGCKIVDNSNTDMSSFTSMANRFYPYAKEYLGFDRDADIVLVSDKENATDPLGKTAYYEPSKSVVTLYVDGRHPKDILRSLAHELVHHTQNCRHNQGSKAEPPRSMACPPGENSPPVS